MPLNRRALLLILPVALLTSLILVSLGFMVQRQAVIGLERSRLDHDLAALGGAYREADQFSRNLLFTLATSPVLQNFLRQGDNPLISEALGTQLQQSLRRLAGSDLPSYVSLSVARPDLSLAYYYESSADPFAQPGNAQHTLLERLANDTRGPIERRTLIVDDGGRPLIVATTALLPGVHGVPLPGQRAQAYTVQLALRPDRFETLRAGLERRYEAPLQLFTGTSLPAAGPDETLRLGPDLHARLNPSPTRLQTRLWHLGLLYLGSGLLVTLISMLMLVVLIRRHITRPIARLDRQLTEVFDGRRQVLTEPSESGEIGRLGSNMKRLHDSNLAFLEQLRTTLRTDALTQIGNRSCFQSVADAWLAAWHKGAAGVALLYLGLDHFKTVNDRYGHAIGDRLLQSLAQQIQGLLDEHLATGEEAVFTRLAGDEFAILFRAPAITRQARALAERLSRHFSNGLLMAERRYPVTLSIGLALPELPLETAALLAHADLAMHRAKLEGRNTLVLFTPALAAQQQRQDVLDEHLRALEPDAELHLVYMPAVDAEGRVRSVETLLRWTSPSLGVISPAEFIPIAERQGHYRWIDRWVVDRALRDYPALSMLFGEGLTLSVNLSSAQLEQADILPYLCERSRHHQVDPRQLELEFTETFAAEVNDNTLTLLRDLRAQGFRVAIDDFGVGYTSIQQVIDYPADTIKFDRLIVERLGRPQTQANLAALIAFCHARDAQVIAEGVDTEVKRQCLQQAGCDLLQGFLICPPRRLEELHDWQRQLNMAQV